MATIDDLRMILEGLLDEANTLGGSVLVTRDQLLESLMIVEDLADGHSYMEHWIGSAGVRDDLADSFRYSTDAMYRLRESVQRFEGLIRAKGEWEGRKRSLEKQSKKRIVRSSREITPSRRRPKKKFALDSSENNGITPRKVKRIIVHGYREAP